MSSAAAGPQARSSLLGSLKDVLAAAGRDNTVPGAPAGPLASQVHPVAPLTDVAAKVAEALASANDQVPAAAAASGSRVEWRGLASISGSFKLTVRPLATLAAGTTLPVMATLDAASGATAVGDFAMVVR